MAEMIIDPPHQSIADLEPTLVRASAGTGKTYQLTARLMRVLLQGASPETLLATTFTRKAAGEILARLLSTLAAAADPEQPEALEDLRQQVDLPGLPRNAAADLLLTIVSNVHRLRIATIDSLFSQLARTFGREIDLPPGWRLSDDIEESRLRTAAIRGVLRDLRSDQTLTLLTMLSRGDVRRSVENELIGLVEQTYNVMHRSPAELWGDLQPGALDDDDWQRTETELLEAVQACQSKRHLKKLKELADLVQRRDREGIASNGILSSIATARQNRSEVLFFNKPFEPCPSAAFEFLYAVAKNHWLGLLSNQNEATGSVLTRYADRLAEIRRGAGLYSFDDIAARLGSCVRSLDEGSLHRRLDGQVDHLLLDEFQDTSAVQWSVVEPMAKRTVRQTAPDDAPRGSGEEERQVPRSFFCVGDSKQAIYRWRGGTVEVFDSVDRRLGSLRHRQQDLSYRSSPVITDTVTDVFHNLTAHPILTSQKDESETALAAAIGSFGGRFPKHQTARNDLSGTFELRTANLTGKATAAEQREACIRSAVELAARLHQQNPKQKIAVLTRTNESLSQCVRLMVGRGLEASQEGGHPLTDSAAVDLLLSALMSAEHPGDRRWAFHLSGTPLENDPSWTPVAIRRRLADDGLVQTVRDLADRIAPMVCGQETMRLKQLMRLAMVAQRQPNGRIRDFVEVVRETKVERAVPANIRVMTVHRSKGLEFDTVILPELDKSLTGQSPTTVADVPDPIAPPRAMTRYLSQKQWHLLPKRWQTAFTDDVYARTTEALCLMYVAMTRAKRSLYAITAPNAKLSSQKTMSGLMYAALSATTAETPDHATDPETPDAVLIRRTFDPNSETSSDA